MIDKVVETFVREGHGCQIWKTDAEVGECPFWDHETNSLFFVDIRKPSLNQYSADGTEIRKWPLPEPVGAFALLEAGTHALVGLKSGLARLDLFTGALERLLDPEPNFPTNRINEGKVSPCGNWFLFGSMDESGKHKSTGSFYALSSAGRVHRLADGLVVANGLAWSVDGSILYYSDSWSSIIFQCNWNPEKGEISSNTVFVKPTESQGMPDGAVIDTEGCYWSAGVSTGRLNRFAPDGTLIETIHLPVQAPTMPTFGPRGSNNLFVTSHRRISNPQPDDGAIVVLPVPTHGIPVPRFAMTAQCKIHLV